MGSTTLVISAHAHRGLGECSTGSGPAADPGLVLLLLLLLLQLMGVVASTDRLDKERHARNSCYKSFSSGWRVKSVRQALL